MDVAESQEKAALDSPRFSRHSGYRATQAQQLRLHGCHHGLRKGRAALLGWEHLAPAAVLYGDLGHLCSGVASVWSYLCK